MKTLTSPLPNPYLRHKESEKVYTNLPQCEKLVFLICSSFIHLCSSWWTYSYFLYSGSSIAVAQMIVVAPLFLNRRCACITSLRRSTYKIVEQPMRLLQLPCPVLTCAVAIQAPEKYLLKEYFGLTSHLNYTFMEVFSSYLYIASTRDYPYRCIARKKGG